jgi:hypothetical protein
MHIKEHAEELEWLTGRVTKPRFAAVHLSKREINTLRQASILADQIRAAVGEESDLGIELGGITARVEDLVAWDFFPVDDKEDE